MALTHPVEGTSSRACFAAGPHHPAACPDLQAQPRDLLGRDRPQPAGIAYHFVDAHPTGGCDGCRSSGQVDQEQISKVEVLPVVLYRVVAPSFLQPWYVETEQRVLDSIEQMDFPASDAVIHRLDLGSVNLYQWTRLAYQAPASKGSLIPYQEE